MVLRPRLLRLASPGERRNAQGRQSAGVVKPWPRDSSHPRYHHTYLELGEWEYWTMGEPVDETTLINRALLPGLGLRVDVLPAGEQERDRQDEDHTGVGAELEQRL